jgi:TIR domain
VEEAGFAEVKITNRNELEAWFKGRPREFAQVIALRAALRVLPLTGIVYRQRLLIKEAELALAQAVFRVSFVTWAAHTFPARELLDEVASALAAATHAAANVGDICDAAISAAESVTADIDDIRYAAANAVAAAVYAVADANTYTEESDHSPDDAYLETAAFWEGVGIDASWLENTKGDDAMKAQALAVHALWEGAAPVWADKAWTHFKEELHYRNSNWDYFCHWYSGRLTGQENGFSETMGSAKALDIGIATQSDAWWKRGPDAVNRDIAELVERARASDAGELLVSDFILDFIGRRNAPSTIKEIENALLEKGFEIIHTELADLANDIADEGRIRRVSNNVFESAQKSSTDFLISYSNKDQVLAKRIGAIVEGEGFTSFAQFQDMPVGSNFINEMKRGLKISSRLIAVLSPDYESSKHCQSEWNAAYNEDPDGSRRKLIGFLTRETELNKLAKQFVYKDLTGLDDDAFRSAVIETIRAAMAGAPPPAARSKTPFDFGWTKTGKIAVLGGGMDHVSVPANRSPADAKKRLEAARILAQELADDYRDGRKNSYVRPEFVRHLDRYADKLPSDTDGNIYLSDSEARSLRTLFENDLKGGLDDGFAARMRTLLEHHQGIRPYFPDLIEFYQDVRIGKLSDPFPLDAVAKTEGVVAAHTPSVFMPDVSGSLDQVEQTKPDAPAAQETGSAETAPPLSSMTLPPDPIADIDPERAAQQAKAGALNRIWQVLLRAEKGAKGIERVEKAVSDYGKVIGPIVDWLSKLGG